jgi:hypothetical protein
VLPPARSDENTRAPYVLVTGLVLWRGACHTPCMVDPIAEAIRRRDEHLAQAKRWDDFIAMYRELQGASPEAPSGAIPMPSGEIRRDAVGTPTFVIGLGRVSETERAAAEIIRESGRPVPTQQLLKMLPSRGVVIGGKDPASTLAARLSRAPSLVSERGIGWRIKDEPPQMDEGAGLRHPSAPAPSGSTSALPAGGPAPVPSASVEPDGEGGI